MSFRVANLRLKVVDSSRKEADISRNWGGVATEKF